MLGVLVAAPRQWKSLRGDLEKAALALDMEITVDRGHGDNERRARGRSHVTVLGTPLTAGAVAAIATFAIQQQIADQTNRRSEKREAALVDWRRDVDNALDKRQRQDDLIRSMLNDTVTAYNTVKNVRRSLQADLGHADQLVSIDSYDSHLSRDK